MIGGRVDKASYYYQSPETNGRNLESFAMTRASAWLGTRASVIGFTRGQNPLNRPCADGRHERSKVLLLFRKMKPAIRIPVATAFHWLSLRTKQRMPYWHRHTVLT